MPSPFKSKKVKFQNGQPLSKVVTLKNVQQVKVVMKDKCVGTEDLDIDGVGTNNDKEDALDLINSAFMDDMCCSLCCTFLVLWDSNNSGDFRESCFLSDMWTHILCDVWYDQMEYSMS